jgi:23S rRNA pseudouridine955/2504/2580 synthase
MAKIRFDTLVLFEDDDYIVINKPAQVASLDDRNEDINILKLAKSYTPTPQLCHRLDKETTGALAIAKNPEAYRSLAIQFEDREVGKIYHAIADGIHSIKNLTIDQPLTPGVKGVVRIDRSGKDSVTIVNTLETFKMHSLLECKPLTGRMHQIRVHLASVGAPISGDQTYGGKPLLLSDIKKKYKLGKWKEESPIIRRTALHAHALEFNSMNAKIIKVEAPYPKDFAVAVKQLKKYE